MTNLSISNSPVGARRYHRSKRLMFLFASLRTRSLMARNELASIAIGDGRSFVELTDRVHSGLLEKSDVANLGALRDLAWLLSNQTVHESDLAAAAEIYSWIVANFGWRRLPQMHRIANALAALRLGRVEVARAAVTSGGFNRRLKWFRVFESFIPRVMPTRKAQKLTESLNGMFMFARDYSLPLDFLEVDIVNPFRGLAAHNLTAASASPASSEWLTRLNRVLIGKHAAPLSLDGETQTESLVAPFERLSAPLATQVSRFAALPRHPLVTIVVSTFEPNEHIFTSVRSALNQTYSNLEVLVVDDASPLHFDEILQQVAALDSRVRVLRQGINGGTYRIRNRALDEAKGELITFQDSDDWMHPQRIELQVAQLLGDETAVANISMSTRMTERLEGAESGRRLRIGICEPALMFWRERVRNQIGYFDTVRKGGDTEYRKRIERAFGTDTQMVLPFRTLTIQRADNGGLTQGELGFRWIAEFRTQYRDSYLHWQSKLGKAVAWRLERTEERAFYAPRQSTMVGVEARASQSFNIVFAANYRDPANTAVALEKIETALAAGLSVGLLQINSLYPLHLSRAIAGDVLNLLNAGKVQLVQPHFELQVGKVEILAPNAWLSSWSAEKFIWRVAEVWPTAPVDAVESFMLASPEAATELARQLGQAFGSAALVNG